jgi:hypothetical protein
MTVTGDRLADRRHDRDGRSRRFHRGGTGHPGSRSLGRHAVSRAGRPRPLANTAPQPADSARQRQRAGNPRAACLWCRCSRHPQAPPGRRPSRTLPARLQRLGRGCAPTEPDFARTKSGPAAPPPRVDRVGTVQRAGLRLDALPRWQAAAPNSCPSAATWFQVPSETMRLQVRGSRVPLHQAPEQRRRPSS